MSPHRTLPVTSDATSSAASADGNTRSRSRGGRRGGKSGAAVARVNRSQAQAALKAFSTRGTYGPLFNASSPSAGLQRFLASRLQARLGVTGSPEYVLTWKTLDMPSGVRVCQLRASARRTSDSGSSGWPTPDAGAQNITDSTWEQRREAIKAKGINGNGFGLTLGMAATLAGWPTPQVHDAQGPKSEEAVAEMRRAGRGGVANLNETARLAGLGIDPNPSPAATAKPGVLNPAFVRWLQGFPPIWDATAPAKRARIASSATRKRGGASGKRRGEPAC